MKGVDYYCIHGLGSCASTEVFTHFLFSYLGPWVFYMLVFYVLKDTVTPMYVSKLGSYQFSISS